jgi:hypothetical protein
MATGQKPTHNPDGADPGSDGSGENANFAEDIFAMGPITLVAVITALVRVSCTIVLPPITTGTMPYSTG